MTTTTITIGRELQMTREVARVAYRVGRDVDRTGLLKKLKKKRKYRKLEAGLRVLVGLALTDEGAPAFVDLRAASTALEAKLAERD